MNYDPVEQDEIIRNWWRRHGKNLITGLLLALVTILAVQWWLGQQRIKQANASVYYAQMLDRLAQGEAEQAKSLAGKVMEMDDGSPYAALAALAVARLEVEEGRLEQAAQRLAWAEDRADFIAGGTDWVRLRIARLQMGREQWDQALATLGGIETAAFNGLAAALRGDIYRQQGQMERARTAYETALGDPAIGGQTRALLQMKLDDLGGGSAG